MFALVMILVGPRILRRIRPGMARLSTHNAPLIIALAVCFSLSYASAKIGMAAIIGAFFAGRSLQNVLRNGICGRECHAITEFLGPFSSPSERNQNLRIFHGDVVWVPMMVSLLSIVSKVIGCGLPLIGENWEDPREPELERVLPDQPVAERMERPDRRVRVAVRDELVDPDLHLRGGLLGERQREDLRRPRPARRDQPGDPPGDDLGLAGPGPGDDEERAVAVRDRPSCSGLSPPSSASRPAGGSPVGVAGPSARSRPRPGSARGGRARDGCAGGSRVAEGGRIRGHARSSPGPVTPSLSDRPGDPVANAAGARRRPRAREREPERLGLLLGQRAVGAARADRLGVDARPGPGVEAADDEAVAVRVGQGEREALVAAGVLERVEPDEADPLDRPPARSPRGSRSAPHSSSSSRATA